MKDLEEWQRNIRSKDRFENVKEANQNADSQSNSVVSTHFDPKATLTLDSKSVSNANTESKMMTNSESKLLSAGTTKIISNVNAKTTPNSYQFADFDKLYNPYKVPYQILTLQINKKIGPTRN